MQVKYGQNVFDQVKVQKGTLYVAVHSNEKMNAYYSLKSHFYGKNEIIPYK